MKKLLSLVLVIGLFGTAFVVHATTLDDVRASIGRARLQQGAVLGDTTTSVPTGLTTTAVSDAQITLGWIASTGDVGGYQVYRNGFAYTQTTDPVFTDTQITPTVTYTYTVSAFNTSRSFESAQSIPVTISRTTAYQTTGTVNVRANPTVGATGTIIGKQAKGAVGTVVAGTGQVSANGYIWVKLTFTNGMSGWVATNNLLVYKAALPVMTGTVVAASTPVVPGIFTQGSPTTTPPPPTTLPPCHINSFTTTPGTVAYGGSTTLAWSTTGCTNALLNNSQLVLPNGSMVLDGLTAFTTYQFKAASLPAGCKWTDGVSTSGVTCMAGVMATGTQVYVASPTLPEGCTSTTGYSATTGLPCSGKGIASQGTSTTDIDTLIKSIAEQIARLQEILKDPVKFKADLVTNSSFLPKITPDQSKNVALFCIYNSATGTSVQYANAGGGWIPIASYCYSSSVVFNPSTIVTIP